MKQWQRTCFFVLALACSGPGAPRVKHLVIVGVDGLGSAGVRQAKAPALRRLMSEGAHTLSARAVIPTVSSPNWASIVMGAGPAQHGITSNDWQPDRHEIKPVCQDAGGLYPTIFSVLRDQQPAARSALFHHWKDFARLLDPRSPSRVTHESTAQQTMGSAIRYWRDQKPSLLFIHLDEVDHAGHEHGWEGSEYKAAVEQADSLIALLLDAVPWSGNEADTAVLVTADHGGIGKKHGGLTMAEIEIPWILAGPGVRRGAAIPVPVNTYDSAATAAFLLGLRPHPCWLGRAVQEAFE